MHAMQCKIVAAWAASAMLAAGGPLSDVFAESCNAGRVVAQYTVLPCCELSGVDWLCMAYEP